MGEPERISLQKQGSWKTIPGTITLFFDCQLLKLDDDML